MLFPNFFLALRARRIRQFEVASHLGVSDPTFSRKINGRSELTDAERQRIAKFLGFDPAWLFEPAHIPTSRATAQGGVA